MRFASLLAAATLSTLIGCAATPNEGASAGDTSDLSERAPGAVAYPPSSELAAVLDPMVARGLISDADYEALKPILEALPGAASPDARAMIDVSFRVTFAPAARAALNAQIERWGYRLEGATDAAAVIATNVTEEDKDFAALYDAVHAGAKVSPFLLGVIDGGFEVEHVALLGRFWTNSGEIAGNRLDDDNNGLVDDIHGYNYNAGSGDLAQQGMFGGGGAAHGTHVAGIALRGTKKNLSLIGMTAQNAARIADSLTYLVASGARVITFSLSAWGNDLPKVLAVIDANPDVLFIESAGNNGKELGGSAEFQPETDLASNVRPNFVKVAAAETDLTRQKTSNFSATRVDVAAIGPQMSAAPFDFQPSGYVYTGKTSQAAPFVANEAARIRMLAPTMKAVDVKELLIASSDELPQWKDVVVANGLVNPLRAARVAAFATLTSRGASAKAAFDELAVPAAEQATVAKLAAR